jgi:hypothetical protein
MNGPTTDTGPALTIGGRAALATRIESGIVFCRQMLELNGQERHIIAAWKVDDEGLKDSPVYVTCIDRIPKTTETLLGCAVLALEHLGIGRPRLGTIQRVAGAFAEMMQPHGA